MAKGKRNREAISSKKQNLLSFNPANCVFLIVTISVLIFFTWKRFGQFFLVLFVYDNIRNIHEETLLYRHRI